MKNFRKKNGDAPPSRKTRGDFSDSGWEDFDSVFTTWYVDHHRSELLFAFEGFAWKEMERMVLAQQFVLCVERAPRSVAETHH